MIIKRWEVVEKLCKLLFELSSSERMSIMLEIQKKKLKLSHISKNLDLAVTEASRHLQRLSEARLVEKDVEGTYRLTPFGELTLSLLSGLDFISRNRDYFMEYDISPLPYEFINRIGELAGGELGVDIFKNIHDVEIMLQEAQEYVWILSDQILMSTAPILVEKVKSGVEYRIILPKDLVPPTDYKHVALSSVKGVQRKVLPKVDVVIVITEKVATVCLPNQRGKIDYIGFGGSDPKFHKWCKDLYLHHWEKAKLVTGYAVHSR